MHQSRLAVSAFAVVATACGCVSTYAAVLVDNVSQPTRSVTTMDANLWAAQSFLTDAGAHRLEGIDILAGSRVDDPFQYAALYSAGAGGPASLLSTFSIVVGPGALAVVNLLPAVQVGLAPSTAYWLVIGASGTGSLGWAYAEGNAYSGTGSFGAYAYSNDLGVSWGSLGTDNPYQMTVQVGVVPEPETYALMLAGLGAIGMVARRRKSLSATARNLQCSGGSSREGRAPDRVVVSTLR